MPFVEISRDEFAKIADQVEDRAYTLPAGPERTEVLLQAYSMQTSSMGRRNCIQNEMFAKPEK